jgi:hypothetical protein
MSLTSDILPGLKLSPTSDSLPRTFSYEKRLTISCTSHGGGEIELVRFSVSAISLVREMVNLPSASLSCLGSRSQYQRCTRRLCLVLLLFGDKGLR